jgi:hypothetical protein
MDERRKDVSKCFNIEAVRVKADRTRALGIGAQLHIVMSDVAAYQPTSS